MEAIQDIITPTLPDKNSGFNLFADLVNILGTSTKTNEKLKALSEYFATAPDADKVWVIAIFSGRRPKRIVNSTLLSLWCLELTGLPAWMYEECYHTVGDLAETIALLLTGIDIPSELNKTNPIKKDEVLIGKYETLSWYLQQFILLEKKDELIRKQFILDAWSYMDQNEKFVFNKLITGGFRIGVSQKTIVNALAKTVDLDASIIAHRISGNWDPNTVSFDVLMDEGDVNFDASKPYPFYLAYALDEKPETLGDVDLWQAEWKWDGIRGQIIKRNDELFIWSRGEELVTDKFPEYHILKDLLPNGTVLDGEILTHANEKPLPFAILQTRIGRKNITKKQLTEAPVAFFSYDVLEYEGRDVRNKSMAERRLLLEKIVSETPTPVLLISPIIEFETWDKLAEIRKLSRDMNSEGIMLKRKSSIYQVGRKVGDWWKWKIDPLTIDCVMIYAQKGHGRRSNLYTDYTFAVKDGDRLVGFTKAYSGLTDKEFNEVDNFVKRNSIEKFGPVRTVKPELVFEIAFEGIAASNRHKSGVALRFPRMLRWRKDKKVDDINTLDDLKAMLKTYGTAEKAPMEDE